MLDSFNVELDVEQADVITDVLDNFADEIFDSAKTSAINKTMSKYQTATRRRTSKLSGIPIKKISNRFKLHKANKARDFARLFIGTISVRVQVAGFKALKRGGIAYGRGANRVKNAQAFEAKMKSGRTGVFQRRTKKRLPIDEIRIQIHDAAKRAAAMEMKVLRSEFPIIFEREFGFKLSRFSDKFL